MAGKPNAVINSPYLKEIEEFLLEGKPLTFIEAWLKEHEAPISRPTLTTYRQEHFNIQLEAVKEHNQKQSEKRKKKGIKKIITTLELCQKFKDEAHQRDLKELSDSEACKLGIQAGRLEHDITKDEPTTQLNVKVENITHDLPDEIIKEFGDFLTNRQTTPNTPNTPTQDNSPPE